MGVVRDVSFWLPESGFTEHNLCEDWLLGLASGVTTTLISILAHESAPTTGTVVVQDVSFWLPESGFTENNLCCSP